MPYDREKMLANLRRQMGGRQADPNEFKFPKAVENQVIKYRGFILPPLAKGDVCASGRATQDMENYFVVEALHWVDKRPYACPRVMSNGEDECAMCSTGFDLFNELRNIDMKADELKKKKSAVAKQWMPTTTYDINFLFLDAAPNPEEVRGKVLFIKAGKHVQDVWAATMEAEDEGQDPEEPQAHGVFFDENSAFLFQFEIKQGKGTNDNGQRFNDYSTSKFVVLKPGLSPVPIIRKRDGSADDKAIAAILAQRHDLFTKITKPDPVQIRKLSDRLIGVAQGDDGFNEEEAPAGKPAPASKPAPAARGNGSIKNGGGRPTPPTKGEDLLEEEDGDLSEVAELEEVPPTRPQTRQTRPRVATPADALDEEGPLSLEEDEPPKNRRTPATTPAPAATSPDGDADDALVDGMLATLDESQARDDD